MDENQPGCLTEHQIKVANIVYTSLSFVSFLFGLVSILLNRFCYYRYKDKFPVDTTEGIFFLSLVTFTALELLDSFQWVLLLTNTVACTVLGAVREYLIISILAIHVCLGIHLFILMTHPKCLRVIKEVKLKRYKILQRVYVLAALVVPAFIVPWPFIGKGYGNDEYLCWLADNCNASTMFGSNVIIHLMMWHFWAILVWMFAVLMLAIAICHYCTHKSVSNVTKFKCSSDVCAIIPLLLLFIIVVAANAFLFILELIVRRSSFPATLQAAILTPLLLLVYFFIINIRQVRIIMPKGKQSVANANASFFTTYGESYGAHTNFIIPDDEWN